MNHLWFIYITRILIKSALEKKKKSQDTPELRIQPLHVSDHIFLFGGHMQLDHCFLPVAGMVPSLKKTLLSFYSQGSVLSLSGKTSTLLSLLAMAFFSGPNTNESLKG